MAVLSRDQELHCTQTHPYLKFLPASVKTNIAQFDTWTKSLKLLI